MSSNNVYQIIRIIRIKRIKLYNASTTSLFKIHLSHKKAFNLNQVAKELFVREGGWAYIETGAKSKNWRRHEVGQWPSIKQLRRHKVIFAWLGLDLSNQRPGTRAPDGANNFKVNTARVGGQLLRQSVETRIIFIRYLICYVRLLSIILQFISCQPCQGII